MSIHSKKTWLLVGDGAIGELYAVHAIPLRLTRVPAGSLKATREMAHVPDHMPETRNIAHIGNYHGDHQRREDVFVEHIAKTLETAARDGKFDELVVVLPPRALAHFRKIVGQDVQKRIRQEVRGDWTHLAIPDLEAHVAAELPLAVE